MSTMKIAVLAVQGAFAEHIDRVRRLGADCIGLRKREDMEPDFDGLILPGGESTVQGKLLRELGMFAPLQAEIRRGLPVLGTCAGLILLAREISNDERAYFGTLPVRVRRNAYGRQLGSFQTEGEFAGIGRVPMTFIRAPYIEAVLSGGKTGAEADVEDKTRSDTEANVEGRTGIGSEAYAENRTKIDTEVLARVQDKIVAVRCGNQIGIAFHPELDADNRIHEMFLGMCSCRGGEDDRRCMKTIAAK